MKKILTVLLAFAVAGVAFAATAKTAKTAKADKKQTVEFIIIESEDYDAGKEDTQLTQGISQFLGMEPKVTKVAVSEAKKDPKLAEMDYSFLPLYLVKKTDAIKEKLAQHIQYGVAIEKDEFIALPKQTRQGVLPNKEAKPGVLELFVMSQCPYGAMAENKIIEAFFEKPSTSDYNGLYKGKYIDFEAKETKSKTSFNLKNINSKQLKHLYKVDEMGGISFIIVYFTALNDIFFYSTKNLKEYISKSKRNSIPIDEFIKKGRKIEISLYPILDYLVFIDELL